jgi:hypothetical protein
MKFSFRVSSIALIRSHFRIAASFSPFSPTAISQLSRLSADFFQSFSPPPVFRQSPFFDDFFTPFADYFHTVLHFDAATFAIATQAGFPLFHGR